MTLREATDALYAAACAVQDAVAENDFAAIQKARSAVRVADFDLGQALIAVPEEQAS